MSHPHIPFDAINAAMLAAYPGILFEWFPHGRLEGKEFRVIEANGRHVGRSFSVNVRTGKYAEFDGQDSRGGDPIGLYADVFCDGDRVQSAKILGRKTGFDMNGSGGPSASNRACGFAGEKPARRELAEDQDDWHPLVPPPEGASPPPERIFARFDDIHGYKDEVGRLTHFVGRIEAKEDRKKEFCPVTYGVWKGREGWHTKAPAAPRPLYGLNLLAERPNAPVIICEGEKSAIAAQHLFPDYVCVTWFGGTGQVQRADWDRFKALSKNRLSIIIWPDNDEGGHAAAATIAEILPRAHILRMHDLPHGWDAADVHPEKPKAWLRNRLPPEAADDGPPINPWDNLQAPPFPTYILPSKLRRFVEHRAVAMGAGPAPVAWSAISAASSAIHGMTRLRMKRNEAWSVPPAIWVALIGRVSSMKTPIMEGSWAPLTKASNQEVGSGRDKRDCARRALCPCHGCHDRSVYLTAVTTEIVCEKRGVLTFLSTPIFSWALNLECHARLASVTDNERVIRPG